jgi:hypothetical protein
MNRSSPPQQTPTSQIMQDNAMNLNYDSDYQIATIIVNSLKQNELSTGQEFSAQDLENLIIQRFHEVNDNIVKLAVDMIMNDAVDMKGRVAKTDDNNDHSILLVSAN